MKNIKLYCTLLMAILVLSASSDSGDDDYETPYEEDSGEYIDEYPYYSGDPTRYLRQVNCGRMSAYACRRAPECKYQRRIGTCVTRTSTGGGTTGPGAETGAGQQLTPLTPPSPRYAPADKRKSFESMKRTTRTPGMHLGCACYFPLPPGAAPAGGYLCWCL